MKSSLVDPGYSSVPFQGKAALVAGLSYIGAVGATAIGAASESPLVNEAMIAAATGSVGGFIGLLGAVLVRQIRGMAAGRSILASNTRGRHVPHGPRQRSERRRDHSLPPRADRDQRLRRARVLPVLRGLQPRSRLVPPPGAQK
jgi:hypothetical protein